MFLFANESRRMTGPVWVRVERQGSAVASEFGAKADATGAFQLTIPAGSLQPDVYTACAFQSRAAPRPHTHSFSVHSASAGPDEVSLVCMEGRASSIRS